MLCVTHKAATSGNPTVLSGGLPGAAICNLLKGPAPQHRTAPHAETRSFPGPQKDNETCGGAVDEHAETMATSTKISHKHTIVATNIDPRPQLVSR